MSKELDEYCKMCSHRIIEIDDTPLVKVMDGGKFKMLSIEEYEEMTNKLADLEAKLAKNRKWLASNEGFLENQKLKQQLAEKEKEYQSFKKIADENVNYLKNRILEETRNHNQDKIAFCIEQLEKVKIYADIDFRKHCYIDAVQLDKFIDNQIKHLKTGGRS